MPTPTGLIGPITNTDPASRAVAVTKSDTLDLNGATYSATASPASRSLYIGGAGDIAVTMADESKVTFSGAVAGSVLPIRVKRLWSTGTTATLVLALF